VPVESRELKVVSEISGHQPSTMDSQPTLLIVDGHAYAYRAFHAIRSLRSPSGGPTNAIYGFVKMLAKMRAGIGPTHLIVVWDGGLSAERMVLLPEYKAHRPEMPGDLRPQLDGIVDYLKAAGIVSFCGDGVEADDYIACLARQATDASATRARRAVMAMWWKLETYSSNGTLVATSRRRNAG